VVDSSDKLRLADTRAELHALLKEEKLIGSTLLIFCNKQDIEGALSPDQIREFLGLEEISRRHWGLIACSAKTGEGLLEGVDWMVRDVASRIFVND
jgi:ADP-ribosylation factor-like protein 2